jgi:A/G-specific adenine glycosylase
VEHSGAVPQDLQALLALPGIGDYTARAIRCFAFGLPEPVVDTNVRRVLQRLVNGEGEAGPPRTRPDLASAQGALDALGGTRDKVILAQGLMELGAVVCKARVPLCSACPVSDQCRWRARGYPPYTGPKAPTQATFEGSDRQARGIILRELRASDTPVPGHFLQNLIAEPDQFIRAKDSLILDGLVTESVDHPGDVHLAN